MGKYCWSRKFLACQKCGKGESPHAGKGLCERCFRRERYRKRVGVAQTFSWSLRHEKCVTCGTTKSPHTKGGICKRCRQLADEEKVRQEKVERWTFTPPDWDRVKRLETESSGYLGFLEIETYERFCEWQDSNRTNKEVN